MVPLFRLSKVCLPGVGHEGRGVGEIVGGPVARLPLEVVLEEAARVDRRGEHEHQQHVEGGARLEERQESRMSNVYRVTQQFVNYLLLTRL